MEIYLAPEHVYHLVTQISPEVGRDRVEQKKVSLAAGTVGALFTQPKADDIHLITMENRLEPFWLISASSRTVYDRNRSYQVTTGGPEVHSVTLLDQELAVIPQPKGSPTLTLSAVEHCTQELHTRATFDGLTGMKSDLMKYVSMAKTEIADINEFHPEGVLVIPPQVRATAVVRQVTSEVVRPVQSAQVIHEERVDIDTIELDFRPVYAFEYEWSSKGKKVIIELDAVTGDIHTGGKKWSDQVKGIVTRDFLFDISADAAGMIVPGGSIAVKLIKAVVDRSAHK